MVPAADCCYISLNWMNGGFCLPLIFMGVGAMTDFGPLIANPKSFPSWVQQPSLVSIVPILWLF